MAQPAAPLKVVQVCSVEPLQGTTPTSLPLTFFDLLWLRFPLAECLFFYEFPHSTSSFFDYVLPSLKHSLSLTLQHFLPLAGNITWPLDSSKPIINYVPGDVVSFTVAESNVSFNHLSSVLCEAAPRHHLVPHLATSYEQASVMPLQVTVFPNTGFIGITTHHAASDGKSTTSFMKSWAYTCSKLLGESPPPPLSSLPEHLTPLFDRSVIRDPAGISEAFVDAWLKHSGPNNRSLKVWESFVPMQTDAVKGQVVVAEPKNFIEKDGFIMALEGINEALNRVKEDGVLSGAETWISDMFRDATSERIYSTAGSPRFEVYGVDFGWGRPKKVDITSIDKTGAFSLSESRNNNGGIEIGLALNKPEMEAFSALLVQGLESF